jgi:hypothetical protein
MLRDPLFPSAEFSLLELTRDGAAQWSNEVHHRDQGEMLSFTIWPVFWFTSDTMGGAIIVYFILQF